MLLRMLQWKRRSDRDLLGHLQAPHPLTSHVGDNLWKPMTTVTESYGKGFRFGAHLLKQNSMFLTYN